jgi:hypothetical protein
MDPRATMDNVSPTRRHRDRAARIAAELSAVGLALPGTLIERHVRCGKPGCRCHADPPSCMAYWQWTRKTGGKTVTRLVPDDQLEDYLAMGSTTTVGSAPWSPNWKP